MPIQAMILVIFSAVLHSMWNIGLKSQRDTSAGAVVLAFFACGFALIAGFEHLATALTPQAIPYTIGAGLFAGGALVAIGLSFRGGSLGLSYAVSRAGGVLLLWPISYFFLDEKITTLGLLGAGLLTISITLIMTTGKHEKFNKYLLWALLSALCIVGYSVFYKKAIGEGANTFALLGLSDLLRVGIAFALLGQSRMEKVAAVVKDATPMMILLGAISFGSFSIFLYALKSAGAAQLGTLRNLSIVFTALGATKIGERLNAHSYALVGLAALGAILVGLK